MKHIKLIIRITSVVLFIAFVGFMFTQKSMSGMDAKGKLIEINGDIVTIQINFSNREVIIDELNGLELIEGQWYEISQRTWSWGYYPLKFEVEDTFSLTAYWEFE